MLGSLIFQKYEEAESYFIIYLVTLRINLERFMQLGQRIQ
jgi:hypothetical protein